MLAVLGLTLLEGGRWFSLAAVQAAQADLQLARAQHPLTMALAFMGLFIALFALALPVGSVMSLAGGAIFGFWWGVLLVSFASTLGATLAFLVGRHLLADAVRQRFGPQLVRIDAGIERDGAAYLFSLRLVPVFPPALLSVLFGLTRMGLLRFYLTSQLGMFSGTLLYVNAGTQLARLQAPGDILSPRVLGALLLLACGPWLLRAAWAAVLHWRGQRGRRFTRGA